MWILWALCSAICAATRRTNEKKLTLELHSLTISFMVQLLSLPAILAAVLVRRDIINPLHQGLAFWLPLLVVCVGFYPLNAILYLGAVKNGELSKVLPIQSLWPVLSLLPAWLLLHELPTPTAVLGVLLVVCGVYALGLKGKQLHHPLQPFREDKSSLYMLLAVALVTIAGVLDKIAIEASNATFYSLMSTIGAIFVLYTTMRIRKISEIHLLKRRMANLSITGLLQGSSYTSYLIALSLGPIAYVSAIRSSNVLMGAMLGIVLLKERLTLPKVISSILILIGGVVLAIGS
jgi:uncharacterized membrane protein